MPPSSFLKQLKVDHCARLVLTADLEFDATVENLNVKAALSGVPWAGTWTVAAKRKRIGLLLEVLHGRDLPVGLYGKQLNIRVALEWLDEQKRGTLVDEEVWESDPLPKINPESGELFTGKCLEVPQENLEEAALASGGLYDVGRHRAYRFIASFEHVQYPPSGERQAESCELARRTAGLNLEQLPHNVRLFFPRAHKDGAELWIKGDILSRSSPYLKDLLSSDFAEAQPRRSKRARTSGAVEAVRVLAQDGKDFEDSDDETDEFLFSKKPPSLFQSSEADDVSFRQITITQAAFSTYHAVLVYLQTGFVHFAPLSSSFPLANPAFSTRRDFLASKYDEDPSLPVPVSPTSAYRLAHLLQLEDLQKRALDAVRSSLTVKGAATELFSDTSVAYEEPRKVTLEFVKDNWAKVRESEGWKEMMERADRDEVPASIVAAALRAVAKE